jgi:hypothetical protein
LDCFSGTPSQYAAWVNWGKPDNWCGCCWSAGDVDDDEAITYADVQLVYGDYLGTKSNPNADNDMDGAVTYADVQKVYGAYLDPNRPTLCNPLCP